MVPVWWSVLLTTVGMVGLFIAGNRSRSWRGWLVGIDDHRR